VAPVLVLASYAIAPRPLDLVMGNAGVAIIFVAVLCETLIAGDGRSHWFKGVQLLCVYALIALFCFYLPDSLAATPAP
jgi:Ca2+:H+ antiporter